MGGINKTKKMEKVADIIIGVVIIVSFITCIVMIIDMIRCNNAWKRKMKK